VSGSIIPPPSNTVQVTLTFTQPDRRILNYTVNSNSTGSYNYTFSPNVVGNWFVIASWEGDEIYEGATSETALFKVNPSTSNLMILFLVGGVIYIIITFSLAYRISKRRFILRFRPKEE
ncbi:MAG: Ig-like domain repeat protein, partial [archaeon]|nr:Ig-like domain repeat protein [archaeon]